MTEALLFLLVLVELARLSLQYWSGKTLVKRNEKTYCEAFGVENIKIKVFEDVVQEKLDYWGKLGYEISAVTYSGYNKDHHKHSYTLFFTKKKIKNFVG